MEVTDLPRPHIATVAIVTTPDHVLLRVHRGSPIPCVATDIATDIDPQLAPGWLTPFGHQGPIDLAAIIAAPERALGRRIISIPAIATQVPRGLQAPWLTYA